MGEDTTSVEMATFVAAHDPAVLPKVQSYLDPHGSLDNAKEAFCEPVEFALSMVYGQAWQVWAKSRAVRERIVETFPDAQVVPWTEKLRARDHKESVA